MDMVTEGSGALLQSRDDWASVDTPHGPGIDDRYKSTGYNAFYAWCQEGMFP